jgi:adenylate cyclase
MPFKLVPFTGDQDFDLSAKNAYIVGRAVTSDIPIFDPTISRRHAELVPNTTGVTVKDLGSSNGTFINGTRVTEGMLAANDSVTFGKVVFQLKSLDATPLRPQANQAPAPNQTIVRQVSVSGGGMPAVMSPSASGSPSGVGQLKVAGVSTQERQAKKLSLLLEVAQKLSGELDLDKVLGRVVTTTFDVMNVDRVSVLLRNDGTGELIPRMSKSRLGDASAQHVPRSIARKAVEERVAILSDNAAADDRFKGGQSIMIQSVRSAMCIPLMASAEQVLGILYVDNLTATNSFSDEDLQFLIAFGGLAAIAIKTSRFAEQIQREAMVRSNFERYFAPNVAAEIAQQQGAVKLGGDRRPVTILFSDIRGFTSMSEHMSPDAIAGLLTDYFTEMVEVVFSHGGTLDKFIGDAIMALWGAPIPHADDPDRAVAAAIGMQRALVALNEKWKEEGKPEIGVGIGINYGDTFAGNIGSHLRLEYTVIGDAVNVASRLCSKSSKGEILISDPLYQMLKDKPAVEPLEPLAVKNRAAPVPVWKVKI